MEKRSVEGGKHTQNGLSMPRIVPHLALAEVRREKKPKAEGGLCQNKTLVRTLKISLDPFLDLPGSPWTVPVGREALGGITLGFPGSLLWMLS